MLLGNIPDLLTHKYFFFTGPLPTTAEGYKMCALSQTTSQNLWIFIQLRIKVLLVLQSALKNLHAGTVIKHGEISFI